MESENHGWTPEPVLSTTGLSWQPDLRSTSQGWGSRKVPALGSIQAEEARRAKCLRTCGSGDSEECPRAEPSGG